MKLLKGINRDFSFNETPEGSWVGGKDLMFNGKFNSIISEPGTNVIKTFTGSVCGKIELSIGAVIFVRNGNYSEIHKYEDGSYNIKLKTEYLDFDVEYPIKGEYRYNFKNELIIEFHADNFSPKLVNLDDLPFEVNTSKELLFSEDITLIDYFIGVKEPIYTLNKVRDNGGNLEQAIYYVSLQYKYPDGSYSNFTNICNPILVIRPGKKEAWEEYTANKTGTNTSKCIDLNISNLDTKFEYYRLAIIKKTDSGTTCYLTDDKFISKTSLNVIISSINTYVVIPISEIIINSTYYDRIVDTVKIDDVLYMLGGSVEDDIEYQQYACNITTKWVYKEQVTLDVNQSSYKDEVVLFNKKTFMPGEIIALYIRFVGNGRKSKAFHIPGRVAIGTEKDAIATDVYKGAKEFQFYDTATKDVSKDSGTFGYWENVNEFYPDDDQYNGELVDVVSGVNLKTLNVRHHKFPSLGFLIEDNGGNKFIDTYLNPIVKSYVKFEGLKIVTTDISIKNQYSNVGEFSGNGIWVNNNGVSYDLSIEIYGFLSVNNKGGELGDIYISIKVFRNVGGVKTYFINKSIANTDVYDGLVNFDSTDLINTALTFADTNSLEVEIIATSTGIDGYLVDGDLYCIVNTPEEINSDVTAGRILGISLSNIIIPDTIKSKYTHYEILYAERTADNTSVLGQSMLIPARRSPYVVSPLFNEVVFDKFYAFDLLRNRLALNPSHITKDFSWTGGLGLCGGSPNFNAGQWVNNDSILTGFPITAVTDILKVNSSKYIQNGVSYSNPTNPSGEEYIYLDLEDPITEDITPTDAYDDGDEYRATKLVCTIHAFKDSVYTSFNEQTLVRTGKLFDLRTKVDTNEYAVESLYGGDTVLNLHGLTIHNDVGLFEVYSGGALEALVSYYLYPCFSTSLIGLRFPGDNIWEHYFPRYNVIDGITGSTGQSIIGKGTHCRGGYDVTPPSGSVRSGSLWWQMSYLSGNADDSNTDRLFYYAEFYGYYNFLHSINNIEPFIIYNSEIENVNNFPFRVHRSLIQKDESTAFNWRTLLPNEYRDVNTDRGIGVGLETNGKDLIVKMQYSTFVYQLDRQLELNDTTVANLGDADIFKTKPLELIPDGNGYVGNIGKFSSLRTKFGIIFIDVVQGKIFIFFETVQEISINGLRDFFAYNLESGFANNNYVNNPYNNSGIFSVWDEKNERVIITKNVVDSETLSEHKFSIDFYPAINGFGFFKSFIPDFSFSDRNGLYYIKDNKIYDALYGINNNTGSSYIDLIFNTPFNLDKKFKAISWNSEVIDYVTGTVNRDKTFTTIKIFNYNRHSNEITLVKQTLTSGNVREISGNWWFSQFKDILKNKQLKVISSNNEDLLYLPTVSGGNLASTLYDKSLFIDKFIIVRLTFDNTTHDIIKLYEVFTNTENIIR